MAKGKSREVNVRIHSSLFLEDETGTLRFHSSHLRKH